MPASRKTMGVSADLAYHREVRDLCRLAPERAIGHIERRTPLPDILAEMIEHVFGRELPMHAARRMAPWRDLFDGLD